MTEKSSPLLDLIWGVSAIATAIGRTDRQTFHMISTGELPARKIGNRWVIERTRLVAHFTEDAA
ncbi:MAG: DNA-binding protein [Aurantimonas endophytica]|uniref:DNA-binding protein n=1 Tax=Aurantimonas endophytica TaxID=1522175 RepID=UPI003003276A